MANGSLKRRGPHSGVPSTSPFVRRSALLYALNAALLGVVWRIQDLFPILGKVKFVAVVAALAIVLWLMDTDPHRSLRTLKHPVTGYALAILALMVLSVPGGVYPGFSFNFIVQDHVKTVLLMLLLGAAVRTSADIEFLVWGQFLGVAIYSIFIMTYFTIGIGGRLDNLVYYDANDVGMLIVCTLPLVIYFLRSGAGLGHRLAAATILPVLIKAIIKTGSRGAFLGLVAVTVYMTFQFHAFSKRVRYGGVAAMVVLLIFTAGDSYWETMSTILHPQDDYNWAGNADEGRMEVWKRGIGYMLQHPLLGVGANAFPAAEGTISPLAARQEYGVGLKWSAPHNSFVQLGAELGVVGLVCFLLLLSSAFLFCWRLGRTPGGGGQAEAALGQALCATLVGYVVAGFFLSQAYAAYMYATYGIVLGLAKVTGHTGRWKARRASPAPVRRAVRSAPPRPLPQGQR